MRTLLSTRLFAVAPLDAWHLRFAMRHGFPSFELYAAPGHLDVLAPDEPEEVRDLVHDMGVRATWLHASRALLDQLLDPDQLHRFSEALETMGIEVVTACLRSWPRPRGGAMLELSELMVQVEEAGARLIVDVDRLDAKSLRKIEYGVGLSWDLGGPALGMDLEIPEIHDLLLHVNRGRLHVVRASHRIDHLREPPGEREALMLEEAWRLRPPGTIVYDVDDPTGFGSLADYEEVMVALKAFHSGRMRPLRPGGGGIGWAALAPG
ncbi:MAG TPA: hypothetical protein VGD74_13220 [Vulgatibacter sp.]